MKKILTCLSLLSLFAFYAQAASLPDNNKSAHSATKSTLNNALNQSDTNEAPGSINGGTGSWEGFAHVLDALTPSANTNLPESNAQLVNRLNLMITQGKQQQALNIINKNQTADGNITNPASDVQLLFLKARATAALGKTDEAIALYQTMTSKYPELAEPWNNLASLYLKNNQPARAQDALNMALTANPNLAIARQNMGIVQLILAKRSFDQAHQLGMKSAGDKANATKDLINAK